MERAERGKQWEVLPWAAIPTLLLVAGLGCCGWEDRADAAFPEPLEWQCQPAPHPSARLSLVPSQAGSSLCLNFIIKLAEILLRVWADSCIEFWFIVWFIRAVDGRLDDLVLQKYLGMQCTAISALLITIIIKINVPPQSFRWLCHSI